MQISRIYQSKIYNLFIDLPNVHTYSRSKIYQLLKLLQAGDAGIPWATSKNDMIKFYKDFIKNSVNEPRQEMLKILNEYLEDVRKRRFLEIFDRKFTCCICLEDVKFIAKNNQYFRNKKNILVALLPCRHSFCDECLTKSYFASLNMRCPLCRNRFIVKMRIRDVVNFQHQYYYEVMQIMDLYERKIKIFKLIDFLLYHGEKVFDKINTELLMIDLYEKRDD